MADYHSRRGGPTYGNSRRIPENIYVHKSNIMPSNIPPKPPEQLFMTPDILSPGASSLTFSIKSSPITFEKLRSPGMDSSVSQLSAKNFYLEPPAVDDEDDIADSPISPGVTVLLSPTAYERDGSDVDAMDFFPAATYPGPRTLEITADKPRVSARSKKVKTKAPKLGLPSPRTPKAWPCMTEPDVSTLPSRTNIDLQRNVLDASNRLASGFASQQPHEPVRRRTPPPVTDQVYGLSAAPNFMLSRPSTRSPPPEPQYTGKTRTQATSTRQPTRSPSPQIKQVSKPVESWKRRSQSFGDKEGHLRLIRQQSRSPSNDSESLRSSRSSSTDRRSARGHKFVKPASDFGRSIISRTPSPVFDDDDGSITDFESVSSLSFDEGWAAKSIGCGIVSGNHTPAEQVDEFYKQPAHKEYLDPQFRRPDLESRTKYFAQNQSSTSLITKPQTYRNERPGLGRIPHTDDYRTVNALAHKYKEHKINVEIESSSPKAAQHLQSRSPAPPMTMVPPERKRSPPIHRDEIKANGASFEPTPTESRNPRTLVSNWLAGVSSTASAGARADVPLQQEVPRVSRKPRIWGRKTRPVVDGTWI